MTSVQVPPVDLAPGMPSRVVTISATDVTEGGQSLEGQMVRFALSDTLDVSSGGDVIAKTQAEVVLDANGEGSIRLPVYDENIKTWCGEDWAILVTATWGSQKAIRVPAGTSSIALSELPPVRPLRGREKQWAITGVSVSTTEGAQWGASVSLNGGILDFDFTVPPGGTAYYRGTLGTAILSTVTETGVYAQPFSANATPEREYPAQEIGVLTVVNQGGTVWQRLELDSGTWKRRGTTGAMPPFELDETFASRGLLGTIDLDTVTTTGVRPQQWATLATPERHYPVLLTGVLIIVTEDVTTWHWYLTDSGQVWARTRYEGVWGEWSIAAGADAATGAMVRRDRARSRKGGRIGTGGRAVVTLRFDDAHDAMASTVMPLLQQYLLPANQAVTVRNVEVNSSRSWAQIQALVNDGVEVFGHSWTHQAASGRAEIHREIIESADYMEAQMPGIAIEGWVMPGTGESGTDAYDGFGPGGSVEAFTDTYAGQLILSRYAVPCGSIQGHLQPLNGAPVTGQVHWTFESETLAATQGMVRQAIATGTGITLMAHPSRFGTSGYMSVADLEALFAWLAAERDAERLLVLTGTGMAFADASTAERMNVVPPIDHGLGWSAPSWSFDAGKATTSATDALTYSAEAVGINHLRGGVLEVTALVNAPTGAVFRMNVGGGVVRTSEHTIPAGGWHRVRMFVHYPTTAGVSAGLTAAFARVSGGAITITDVAVQPV